MAEWRGTGFPDYTGSTPVPSSNIDFMATTTRKKNTEPIKPKVREYSTAAFELQLMVNAVAKGKAFTDATDENPDETYQEAIDRLMAEIDDFFRDAWNNYDDASLERDELKADMERLTKDVEDLEEFTKGIDQVNTMVGALKYETDNLLDAHTMEEVVKLMKEIRPTDLLKILQNTLTVHELV